LNYEYIVGVGWDVGGWMGSNHGAAVARWRVGAQSIEWLGIPAELSIPVGAHFTLDSFLDQAGQLQGRDILANSKIIIGIDAPLAFPEKFAAFLNGQEETFVRPAEKLTALSLTATPTVKYIAYLAKSRFRHPMTESVTNVPSLCTMFNNNTRPTASQCIL
jgi:hypothetical protein